MSDLIGFLRAQLDTDERIAHAADPGPWEVGASFGGGDTRVFIREAGSPGIDTVGSTHIPSVFVSQVANKTRFRENAAHIATYDPARALRQVQAHRAILDLHEQTAYGDLARLSALEDAIQHLASIYSDRDGYREEW